MTVVAARTQAPALAVDLSAIGANTRRFVRSTSAAVMAVVTADGFGAGLGDVARTAVTSGATWVGVPSVAEGVAVRESGVDVPVLSWPAPADTDVAAAVRHDIDLAVPGVAHLARIAAAEAGARVHLRLDTGMAGDGAPEDEWAELMARARRAEVAGHVTVVGVMGRLPTAAEPGHTATRRGHLALLRGTELAEQAGLRPSVRHLAATAAALTDPATHLDMVRIGAGLAGIDPSGTTRLCAALRLTAPVVRVWRVPAGVEVGDGHVTERATTLGLLPIGYADGLPRAARGRAHVLVAGLRRPVAGLVSVDETVVDLGDHVVAPGAAAVVFGPGDDGEPTVADWARWAGTIPHEVVPGIGHRVARSLR